MIDTHAHVFKEYYEDISDVINNAKKNKVDKIIISGCSKSNIKEVVELINKYDNLYATIGYHPDEIKNYNDNDIVFLKDVFSQNKNIIGIGEIGLDYHYDKDSRNEQIILFEKQLALAESLKCPVIIHSREAAMDTYNVLKKYKVKGIIHCFSGSLETAKNYINLGFFLGIGGVITFKNCNLKEVIKNIDLKHIVLETDSPYLAPVPYRGKKNEPAYIKETAKFIADIKNISLEKVDEITTNNVNGLFDLK
ncbi:MAG: TatD family hydrolase [Bacilli bacterium]